MNILILENQNNYFQQIKSLVEDYMFSQNEIDEYKIDILKDCDYSKTYDVAFFYLNKKYTQSLDIAKLMKKNNPNCIIFFISDCYHYIHEAFQINAFQYIFKFMDYSFFQKEMERMLLNYKKRNFKFMLHTNSGKILFRTKDIIYVESYYNHLKIITTKNTYISNIKQKNNLHKILKTSSFIKIQRSFIINMNHIMYFTHNGVLLKNKVFLPTSPLRKEQIMLEYNKFQK